MRPGAPLIGTDLELTHQLGRGGMGAVWAARERSTGRLLAVKLLGRADRPEQLERFRREGQVVAQLDHPGIVRIHTAGETELGPYLVYALVEGARPVDVALEGLPLRRQVELIRDAARALGHAHQRGVVHRDVKPQNLLVDVEGRLRVTDFGVAALRGASRLTRTGALVGTPTHMAPEQLRDRASVGPWSDVWALGVVLYQALTGELPFEGESLPALAAAISQGELVPPRALDPEVDPGLEAICLEALCRRERERYPHGDALADELDRWLEALEPLALRPRRARWPLAAGGLAAALLTGGVALALRRDAPAGPTDAAAVPASAGTPVAVVDPAPVTTDSSDGSAPADPGPLAFLPQPWPPALGPGSAHEHERATSSQEALALTPADQMFLEQALRGDGPSMVLLARAYEAGVRVPRSLSRSLHWLFKAVEQDEPQGLVALGDRYAAGLGLPLDPALAMQAWQRASRLGSADGTSRWAFRVARGPERPQALELLELALRQAELQESWRDDAQSLLALLYEERGAPGDLERADALVAELRAGVVVEKSWPLIEYLVYTRRGDPAARRAEALPLWRGWRRLHQPSLLHNPEFQEAARVLGE